ncbi:hypothetical protein B0J11DRAFT_22483 [Dendryphion nanum]|uniref:Uncharacterized protein n=1 Tax=Dendryphion nanum TaxID=256645 RepID=A0A9P9J273_9PLEO|nr:hypothetical protein B0J11DRAFT_22483 [Dendryphion nanum]
MSLTFALQALLVRHEAYVADSERERLHMLASIDSLEKQKVELEEQNAQTIKANRDLLDQLEELNDAVATSDAQIQALTDTLHSTEEEIQRLSSLAARTQFLEQQLIELEREQAQLQGSLDLKTGDERTAIQRWRRAEKTIGDLQDQIDRIEKEAREERERHVEIVARMERRMAVDGELATAADRLKAKASQEKTGTNVVSHFVKDILLDNTNLQHGILELREMLMSSNEEVERLRDQLRAHQPLSPGVEEMEVQLHEPTSLEKELASEPVLNQELHIHHHYHGPTPKKEPNKGAANRRTRKKRYSLTPGYFTPPVQTDQSLSAAILSQTAVTVPSNMNRWSNATTLAPSSIPSSPLSMSHRGSIYDRVFSDVAYDSSRPTSPSDSVNPSSPMFEPSKYQDIGTSGDEGFGHQRRKSRSLKPPSLSTIRSVSTPISLTRKSSPATAIISTISPQNSLSNDMFTLSPALSSAIPEETEDNLIEDHSLTPQAPASSHLEFDLEAALSPSANRRPLRRATSHESLISISGMDIHTLQSRPSQLLLSSSPRFTSNNSNSASSEPVLTPWTATATANMSRRNLDSSAFNRSLLYGSMVNQRRGVSNPAQKPPSSTGYGGGLSKKVGGWVWGKWGAAPTPTISRPPSSSSEQTFATTSTTKSVASDDAKTPTQKQQQKKTELMVPKLRPAGVNQSGPIWGFFEAIPETPTRIVVGVEEVDVEALGEALAEG